MNLIKFDQEIKDFKTRVIQTFKMKTSTDSNFTKYKTLCKWVYDESEKLKKRDDSKGIKRISLAGMIQKMKKGEDDPNLGLADDLKSLCTHIKNKLIPKTFNFECKSVPSEILAIVSELKDEKWESYYCEVIGPFIENSFICKKEDFHSNIEQVKVNGLKVLIIEEKVAHKYQRNLIQEIFGRVFRSKGSLSMVIKLEVNQYPFDVPYNIYCYIEDRKLVDEDEDCKSLECLKENGSKLEIESKGENIEIDELNILQLFLSEIIVLPVQSLVSNFIVRTYEQKEPSKIVSEIIKCNQQDQKEIVEDRNLREHPSLRNPLLYFSTYLRDHKIKITEAQKISSNKELYACFYKCLEIVIKLIQTDFETNYEELKINSSVCFNLEVFTSVWTIFHKIGLLEEWMTEVIEPIKNNITISEVISHFCPILNEISVSNNDSFTFTEYKEFYSNVEIENYLGSAVSKKALEKYKDIFLNETQIIKNRKYTSAPEIYNQIFKPVINEVNLKYLSPIEVSYILYFYCKHGFEYKPSLDQIEFEIECHWKDPAIWERCIKFNQNHELHFIDIALDILGYACGVNVFLINDQCFEKVKYFEETETSLKGVDWFVDFIREAYEKESVAILSSLVEKSLKYRKYETCKVLFSKKVRITNFREILHFYDILEESDSQTRETLVKTILEDSPQMHRLFKWQENIWIHLKKQTKDSVAVESLDCETLYIPKNVLETHIKNGRIINNLSRKDARFDSNREIALVSYKNENGENIQFYIEITQYPLMIYFYRSLFEKLGIPEIMPYFTSFFYENRLIHIFEHLEGAMNYKKGLSEFKEEEMYALTDESLISEAIILSLIVLPSKISSNDIIICPNKATHDQIFVIDWQSFYCKDFMSKYIGKPRMNSQNCLFLMDKMKKVIDQSTVNKYSKIEIDKIVEKVLKECKLMNKRVNKLKNEYCEEETLIPNEQLLTHVFEEGFIFNLCERMHKISRVFRKKEAIELSFFKVFKIISSSTCYLYQQIHNSCYNLLAREKILANQDWKKSFLQTSMVEFLGSFERLPYVENEFPLYYKKLCFQGPTENLFEASASSKKFCAFMNNKLPNNLIQFNNADFEYYMRNCDLTEMDNSNKEKIIEIIKSKSKEYLNADEKRVLPLSYVSLKNTEFFKDRINSLDFSFERVQEMLIESCKFGEMELNNFPKSVENILYLSLKGIAGLKEIGDATNGRTIEFKHLKTLSIIDCNDLISIDLQCDILENLELRNTKCLENMYMYSNNLKNICVFNNPSLNFESLAIFVIKGINVLICKNSCHGDFVKIYHEDYEVYLAYVLRELLVRFCEFPKSRELVMEGLLKMREVEEKLISKGNLSKNKAISTIYNKFTDIEDQILIEIMRIYSSNPYRKKISIADITQTTYVGKGSISVERIIRLMSEALLKANLDSKHINKIEFENARQFFTKANITNINNLIDRLKVDKNLTVYLSQITNHSDNEEVNATAQREIEVLRKISIDKPEIEKVSVIFKQSQVEFTYLDRIFHKTQSIEDPHQTVGSNNRFHLTKSVKSSQDQKYMKISNLIFDNCEIENDRVVDSNIIEDHLREIGKKPEEEQKGLMEIQMEEIFNDQDEYKSVKSLKIKNCLLENYGILRCTPRITSLSIHKTVFGKKLSKAIKVKNIEKDEDKKFEIEKYKQLFEISSKLELHTLDLKHFFSLTNSTSELSIVFDSFCESLPLMNKLKTLKLNNNYFSLENLKKLDETLNKTTIEELELYSLELPICHNSSQVSVESEISEDPKEATIFENAFANTKKLKSLAIELNNDRILKEFITSISTNTSLIELKLHTNCIITSSTLKPLNENTTLSLMRSNVQLPLWLINHLANNGKNIRKELSKEYILEDNENLDSSPINADMSMSMSEFRTNDFLRIGLSLDGGGMRGMLLASELHYLATRVGYPLHKIFDCIGGTSIGGILALASTGTYDGMNPVADTEELMALFSKYGKDIFKKTQIMQLKNLFDTKYSVSSFEGVLKNYFKDCRLADCLSETNVIVTAVNRVDNKDYIFKSTEALLNRDKDFYMRDVSRATSAAPTYFPSAEIKNVNASLKLSLIDGGVGLNNPSKLVIDDVKKIAANSGTPDNYFLLSLGTGKLPNEVVPESAGLKDIVPILDSLSYASANFLERDMANNYKGHFFRVSPLINLAFKKDGELDNTNDSVIETYRQTGFEAAKKNFENTVIFGKYRNMNLIEWLRENTIRKYEY